MPPLPPEERKALESRLDDRHAVFYYRLAGAGYNATRAVREAGLDRNERGEPYKPSYVRWLGNRYRHHPDVEALVEDDRRRLRMGSEEALALLSVTARFSDMTNFLALVETPGGAVEARLDLSTALREGCGGAVRKYEERIVKRGGKEQVIERRIELYDRVRAAEVLLRMMPRAGDVAGEEEENIYLRLNRQFNEAHRDSNNHLLQINDQIIRGESARHSSNPDSSALRKI